ncbi:hypothetical protein PENSPDRAFT_735611 [Peniophora sp. CONT]|nr:hypothetical protein PENSPDRAFT_735611 [Peniophora sp. CONT]
MPRKRRSEPSGTQLLSRSRKQDLAALGSVNYALNQPDDHPAPPVATYKTVHVPQSNKKPTKPKPKEHKPAGIDKSANLHNAEADPKAAQVAPAVVPAPIPGTGVPVNQPPPPPNNSSTTPAGIATNYLAPATHVSLPPASTFTGAPAPSILLTASSTPTLQAENAASAAPNGHAASSKPSLSVPIISLISVGGLCLLGAVLLCIRSCVRSHRARRKIRPTMSLPILQSEGYDGDPEQLSSQQHSMADLKPRVLAPDESPLFGGAERYSLSRGGTGSGPVKWTQYQSGVPEKHTLGLNFDSPPQHQHAAAEIKVATLATAAYAHAQPVAVSIPPVMSERGMKYKSRLSTLTLAQEPPEDFTGAIGVALSGDDLARVAYEENDIGGEEDVEVIAPVPPAARRLSRSASGREQRRRSRSGPERDVRRSTYHAEPDNGGLAYEDSPVPDAAGRARIKAPYDVHSHIRTSYAPNAHTSYATSAPGARMSMYATGAGYDNNDRIPPMPPVPPPPGRNGALATALGIGSPPTAHTHDARATLYPDDSLSRQASLAVPRKPVPTPDYLGERLGERGRDRDSALLGSPSTSLGRLMLGASSPQPDLHQAYGGTAPLPTSHSRSGDRPPRVPSPPALPSLAQMALVNQEGFDDYRSPTYSIYGMYEADRKSRVTSRVQ